MKKTIKTLAFSLMLSTLILGCAKTETGPKGDKGDKGDQGIQGANGTNGANGVNGTNGVANITTTTLNVTSWTWDNSNKFRYANFNGNLPSLNQSNISNGMIMLYSLGATQLPLPYTLPITTTIMYSEVYEFSLNSLSIYVMFSNGSDPNPAQSFYRLVVIPQSMVKPNVNYKDYNSVAKAYNLAN